MCHWNKWIWPGILTVAILSLLAVWMKRDFIQDDLSAKATATLTTNGQSWAKVELDGRDAVLKGDAPSEEDRIQAAKITDETYQIRVVDNQSGLVAAQSPYILSAKRDGDTVELSGFAPNEIVRDTVIDTAKELLPNVKVADSLTIARGQPENFESLAGFGLTQLAGLTDGEISLSDKALSVKGSARDRDSYDAINTALSGEIPNGGSLASNEITPPGASPYNWSAVYNGETITLDGHVPSNASREAIMAYTKSVLPNAKIADNQLLATGAPEGFEKAAEYALQQLPRFRSGKVGLSDANMSVSGVANSSESYTTALNAIGAASLPAGIALGEGQISPATVSPYTWGMEYDGKTAVLNGFVPDNSTRKAIVENAKSTLKIADVTDNMQVADGAPSGMIDKAGFALGVLQNLAGGKANLSDDQLSITGVAQDVATYKNANSILNGELPAGLALAETNISPATVSPYSWAAKFDGETLELEGFVPDEATRLEILAVSTIVLPNATINDHVQVASGAPADLVGAASFSLEQLSKLSQGSVELNDLNLSVTGVAATVEDYQIARQTLSGKLSSGMKLALQEITPPTVSPYSWGADYVENTLNLTGFVPSEEARAKIIANIQAEFGAAKIVDNMQVAAGAPEAYDLATANAIAVLPKFSKGNVALSGTNLTVNGTAKSSTHFLAAERQVKNGLPEQINIAHTNIVPPINQGDYGWQAKKSGTHIVLSGHVPGRADRQKVAELAVKTNPETTVINRLTFATGTPQNFDTNVDLGLSLLAGLGEGVAVISDGDLTVNGVANSVISHEMTIAMMKDVGGEILPPAISPYSWSIKNGAAGVTLSGFVPTKGIRNTNVAAVNAVLSKPIIDKQRLATGEPGEFGNAAASLIAGVDQLDNSQASITDTNVFLQGRAKSEEEALRIADSVAKSLPKSFSFRHQISFPLPKPAPEIKLKAAFVPKPIVIEQKSSECSIDFMALIDGEKIQFDTAKAIIQENSYPLLDRIAVALKECRTSRIEVGGHTDARGDESYNQDLSEARAQAIVTYMTDKEGVNGGKLLAKGYGELHPIAPNSDAERAKNRRIEFKILDQ